MFVCEGGNGLGRAAVTTIASAATSAPVVAGATLTRPRPQPIAGTPPPDPNEKYDQKMIQQTCTLFGLDLVSKSNSYKKLSFLVGYYRP